MADIFDQMALLVTLTGGVRVSFTVKMCIYRCKGSGEERRGGDWR